MAYEKLKQEQYQNLGGINLHDSKYQTGETKFLDLRNFAFERPGKLNSRPGVEYHLTLNAATFLTKPQSTHQFTRRDGASYLMFDSGTTLSAYNGSNQFVFASLSANATTALPIDFETYDNIEYFANSRAFGRFDGTTFTWFNLLLARDTGITAISGFTFNTALTSGPTAVIASGTWIATFEYARGYQDIYEGPFYQPFFETPKFGFPKSYPRALIGVAATIVSRGRWQLYGMTLPSFYGISGAVPFIKGSDSATVFIGGTPVSMYLTTFGGGTTFWAMEFDHITSDAGYDLTRNNFTVSPQYLALFNNQLFSAGFSSLPSTVFYSEPGQPDNVQAENFFELRTGEGEPITGLEVFQDAIIIFKKRRVFELSGQTSDSFQLRELTSEYGLLNDRAKVVFENQLWFVDKSGIVKYDGANFEKMTEPVDTILDTMDKTKIYAVHVQKKRQIWFCASNTCLVYSYEVNAWTVFDQLPIDSQAGAAKVNYGATRTDVSYWRTGASFHELIRFGDSLATDLGANITLIAQTRFHKRLEQTTQELWRRLFINSDVTGSTQGLTIQLIPDYGTSVYATRNVYLDAFQKRIEFGVSSRSMSVKFILSASQPISLNGYTIESRYLRKV